MQPPREGRTVFPIAQFKGIAVFDEWVRILAGLALVAFSFTFTLAWIGRCAPQDDSPPTP